MSSSQYNPQRLPKNFVGRISIARLDMVFHNISTWSPTAYATPNAILSKHIGNAEIRSHVFWPNYKHPNHSTTRPQTPDKIDHDNKCLRCRYLSLYFFMREKDILIIFPNIYMWICVYKWCAIQTMMCRTSHFKATIRNKKQKLHH